MPDATPASPIRACCPVCRRLWFKDTTVGFAVHEKGWTRFHSQSRTSRSEGKPEPMFVSAFDGASGFHPEVWRGSSGRTATDSDVWHERTIKCREGHLLEVPSGAKLRRMLERVAGEGPLYLPSVRS